MDARIIAVKENGIFTVEDEFGTYDVHLTLRSVHNSIPEVKILCERIRKTPEEGAKVEDKDHTT